MNILYFSAFQHSALEQIIIATIYASDDLSLCPHRKKKITCVRKENVNYSYRESL
jgi:hypothetical protein